MAGSICSGCDCHIDRADNSLATLVRLQAKYATNEADMQGMRRVRNTCTEFLTRDQRQITANEQRLWFRMLERSKVWPFVFRLKGKAVGYGLIRREGRALMLSGGLVPTCRGKGLGTELFGFLVGQALAIRALREPTAEKTCNHCKGSGWYNCSHDRLRNEICTCFKREKIYLEVFGSNKVAYNMYNKLGFRMKPGHCYTPKVMVMEFFHAA